MIIFQRLESAVIGITLLIAYQQLSFSWITFALFILVPDISMLGYLKNSRVGAITYNLGHSYFSPLLTGGITALFDFRAGVMLALIWGAHIAFDRALGFGLKLPTSFKDTHLGKL